MKYLTLHLLLVSFSVLLTVGNNHANPATKTKTPAQQAGVIWQAS